MAESDRGDFKLDARPTAALPLIVDLDGTLLKVDTLQESFLTLLYRRPFQALWVLFYLVVHGRAAMKSKIASLDVLDVEGLPLREDLVAWLRQQASVGRELHLVSAADHSVVRRVGARFSFFSSCVGSDGTLNLKGARKAAYLVQTFPKGFSYAGDSEADILVWQHAKTAILAGTSLSFRRRIEKLDKPIEADFQNHDNWRRSLLKQLRLHQWSKNILVFLPLILAHHFRDVSSWSRVTLAFCGLGIAASATYIVNDLFDLSADRRHATKRNRPLASGALSIALAGALVPFLLLAGVALALAASPAAAVTLLAYLVLTLAYSFRLKRVPLLDTAIIGMLFTLRIILGGAAARLEPSPWLLAFSVTLFFSLAMAKRQAEIAKLVNMSGEEKIAGRGYQPGDILLTLVYGITSGVASLVILMLYTTNSLAAGLYRRPDWLWAIPLLIYLWQMRVWLFAHRGVLDDDPIEFALKDNVSLALGAGCALAFYLAL